MKDKSLTYAAFAPNAYPGQKPVGQFKRIKILYEDNISYYVADLTKKDARGDPIHRSIKKSCLTLQQVPSEKLKAYAKWQKRIQRPDEKLNEFVDEFTKWSWIEALKWYKSRVLKLNPTVNMFTKNSPYQELLREIGENDAD